MKKWPDVPDVYGWLSLDRRGNWLLKSERIGNAALRAFIDRNYMHDEQGRWYFQNGPQRVFAALAATPYVYSLHRHQGAVTVSAHTGAVAKIVKTAALVSDGGMVLDTDLGCGLIQDRDLGVALDAARDLHGAAASDDRIAAALSGEPQSDGQGLTLDFSGVRLPLQHIAVHELAARFHFVKDPQPEAAT